MPLLNKEVKGSNYIYQLSTLFNHIANDSAIVSEKDTDALMEDIENIGWVSIHSSILCSTLSHTYDWKDHLPKKNWHARLEPSTFGFV